MTSYRFGLNITLAGMVCFAIGYFQGATGLSANPTEAAGLLIAMALAFALVDIIASAITAAWAVPWDKAERDHERLQARTKGGSDS